MLFICWPTVEQCFAFLFILFAIFWQLYLSLEDTIGFRAMEKCINQSTYKCHQRCHFATQSTLCLGAQKCCHPGIYSQIMAAWLVSICPSCCCPTSLPPCQLSPSQSGWGATIMLLCSDDAKPLGDMIDHLSTSTDLLSGGRWWNYPSSPI